MTCLASPAQAPPTYHQPGGQTSVTLSRSHSDQQPSRPLVTVLRVSLHFRGLLLPPAWTLGSQRQGPEFLRPEVLRTPASSREPGRGQDQLHEQLEKGGGGQVRTPRQLGTASPSQVNSRVGGTMIPLTPLWPSHGLTLQLGAWPVGTSPPTSCSTPPRRGTFPRRARGVPRGGFSYPPPGPSSSWDTTLPQKCTVGGPRANRCTPRSCSTTGREHPDEEGE